MLKKLSNRIRLTPQFSSYENLKNVWKPFIMYFHEPNYKSSHVNTDIYGFRYTEFNNMKYSPADSFNEFENISIVVGGSTVFGVGSTSDMKSIPSILSNISNSIYLNFGGRAFGSNQELILFLTFAERIKNIKEVIILSGLNELYLSRQILGGDFYGNFFFGSIYNEAMNRKNLSYKRQIYNYFFKARESKKNYYDDKFDVDFAVNQIKKNLFIWKKLADSFEFNLKFVLQPTPQWSKKKLTSEESLLFEELDKYDNHELIKRLDYNLYKDYTNKLEKLFMEIKIPYYDSNQILNQDTSFSNWIFVDRAHLTDDGNFLIANFLTNLNI